jgi:hypothetical protein
MDSNEADVMAIRKTILLSIDFAMFLQINGLWSQTFTLQ